MIQRLTAWVTLAAQDFEQLVQFYQQLLDQLPQPCLPNQYAEFQFPGVRLGIFSPKATHRPEFAQSTGAGMSLCLEVVDLEGAIAQFTTLGCPPPGEIAIASHGREIYAYDPEGNRLILHQST